MAKTQPSRRSTVRTGSTAVPGAAGHFRTSVGTGTLFAEALVRLADEVDASLGRPDPFTIVDVGAARGELLTTLASIGLHPRWRLHGVDVVPPPAAADRRDVVIPGARGGHRRDRRERVVDDLPVEVVEHATDGLRRVLVDPETGDETLGPLVDGPDAVWLAEWWPLDTSEIGDRAEVGRPRDTAWSAAVRSLTRGVAIAIDYCHDRGDGQAGCCRRARSRATSAGRLVPRCRTGAATSPVTSRWTHAPRPAAQWRIVVVARPATRGPPHSVSTAEIRRGLAGASISYPRHSPRRRRRRGSFGAVGWATSAGSSSAWAFRCRLAGRPARLARSLRRRAGRGGARRPRRVPQQGRRPRGPAPPRQAAANETADGRRRTCRPVMTGGWSQRT